MKRRKAAPAEEPALPLTLYVNAPGDYLFVCAGCAHHYARYQNVSLGWAARADWHEAARAELEQYCWADGRCQLCEVAYATAEA